MQTTTLVLIRILIGWHVLYEGLHKLTTPGWTSKGFLAESKWIMAGFAQWITSNDAVLKVVDLMNTYGLIAIGLGLILGLFTRAAAISGATLLFMYYFNNPPLVGLEYSVPAEGNYLLVNKTLIEAVTLLALAAFGAGQMWGVDSLIPGFNKKNQKKTV